MSTDRFKSQFSVPKGTLADATAYGGNVYPQHAVMGLAEIVGCEPLVNKKGEVILGAHKVVLRIGKVLAAGGVEETYSFEDDVVINLPGRPSTDTDPKKAAENAKKDKRSLVTALEATGYTKEQIDTHDVSVAWFAPDPTTKEPKFMSVVFQPGITGVKDSYGTTWPITREFHQKAHANKTDPADMVPKPKAPSGVNRSGAASAAPAPAPSVSVGTPAPAPGSAPAAAPAPSVDSPPTTAPTGGAPPVGMAAFAR